MPQPLDSKDVQSAPAATAALPRAIGGGAPAGGPARPPPLELIRSLLAALGEEELVRHDALGPWLAATEQVLAGRRGSARARGISTLAKSWLWTDLLSRLSAGERSGWAAALSESGVTSHLGRDALAALLADAPAADAALLATAARESLLERLATLDDGGLRDRLVEDTTCAQAMLETFRDHPLTPLGARIARLLPELTALATPGDPVATAEHEQAGGGAHALPLLDHLSRRVLGRKLLGLERGDLALFQRGEGLSPLAFADEATRLERLRDRGLLRCVRAALVHLDFAKGGEPGLRELWQSRYRADLTVHNRAARQILEQAVPPGLSHPGVLGAFTALREQPALARLVLALVESHGLAGQAIRGETPLALFAPWIRYLRKDAPALAEALGTSREDAARAALDCLHAVNVCDTAGVREGLLGDALREQFVAIRDQLEAVALEGGAVDERELEAELAAHEDRRWAERTPAESPAGRERIRIADRLARLRAGRLSSGEPRARLEQVVRSLPDACVERLGALLRRCQLWYAELGSAALSAEAQLKVIALGLKAAEGGGWEGAARAFHVSLLPLVRSLRAGGERASPYRLRLIETMLASLSVADILEGTSPAVAAPAGEQPLVTFATEIGHAGAVELAFKESPEASALLTLLPIYEVKSSAAFHATLKTLCDVYGLRKDEFDRVANEDLYLSTMNSARSDKARMLELARPGRIVEVGPGGGVVLDLLEARFPGAEVIGIDASHMVVQALEQRRQQESHRWRIVEADAFKLPELMGEGTVDTVVFCSVLHEIYSYVEYPVEGGARRRFRLESVRELLRAAYRALVPGGRIIIRDGVMPPPGARILRFLAPDARELFDLFCRQFEGRRISFEPAGEDRVRVSSEDAMEFLYKYTWGPQSFPYEIREQYGVLPYEPYRDRILEWLGGDGRGARWIPLPPGQASYLQEGYRAGLAGKLELFDVEGRPADLPDSNCLLAFEKG